MTPADIVLTDVLQTQTAGHAPRKMNAPDLSTKLKLMGVEVASFGDYFAHERMVSTAASLVPALAETGVAIRSTRRGERDTRNDPVKCLTYHDPFSATYKKFIFTADGEYLLGGIMIGDTGSFTKLVAIIKKKVRILPRCPWCACSFDLPIQKKLDVPPSDFIIGAKKGDDEDGGDLDDDAQICSCHVSSPVLVHRHNCN
jgi:nitrite reductase (NAD(P)H)